MAWWVLVVAAIWGLLILVPLLLIFIVAPIRVHSKQFSSAIFQSYPVTIGDLAPESQEFFERMHHEFEQHGFRAGPLLATGKSWAGATGVTSLMVNDISGDLVSIAAVGAQNSRSFAFSIASTFADSSKVATAARGGPSLYPKPTNENSAAFHWIKDAATLVEAHHRRLKHLEKANLPRASSPAIGEEVAYLQARWIRSHQWHVACGYSWLDEKSQRYRPTWKGAFLLAWKSSPPFKNWRIHRRDRRAQRLWRELGMDQWIAPPIPVIPAKLEQNAAATASEATLGVSTPLRYEPALADGEIRREQTGETLIVRMGAPSTHEVLLKQWPRFLMSFIFVMALAATIYSIWVAWNTWAFLPVNMRWRMAFGGHSSVLWILLIWPVLLALEIRQFIRALRRAGGTTVISTSSAGVNFRNAPGRRANGDVSRDDIHAVNVRIEHFGIRSRRYRLELRLQGTAGRVPLLISNNRAFLQEIATSMLQAMGIVPPAPSDVNARTDMADAAI